MNVYSQWFDVLRVDNHYNTMQYFAGNGGDTFEINFSGGYLDKTHVKALADDDGPELALTFITKSRIKLSRPILTGSNVLIFRDTPKVSPMAMFSDGAIINSVNLDRNAKQAIFVAAEMLDRFDTFGSSLETSVEQVSEALKVANEALSVANGISSKVDLALSKSAEAVAIATASSEIVGEVKTYIDKLESSLGAYSIGFGKSTVGAVLADFTNARFHGAVGDGITDDTVALQKAIDSAKVVYVPAGVYRVRQLSIPSDRKMVGAGKTATVIKTLDGFDRVWHTIVTANATSIDARVATDANVDQIVGDYMYDSEIADMTVDGNWQNRPQTHTDREQGTTVELHKVRRFKVARCRIINGPQHCLNVRAGTGSFNKGYGYKEKYPSQYVYFEDVETDDQLLDDGITTHDSEYIWIENCHTRLTRNLSGTMPAISNGIEVDDGSRYVWVTDCMSEFSFGGYQAKGHVNTPPAHHVWFTRCTAKGNHQAFILSSTGVSNNDLASYEGTANNIYLHNCTIIGNYAFANSDAFKNESHFLQIYNTRDVEVRGLTIVCVNGTEANRSSSFKSIFRLRGSNAGLVMDDVRIVGASLNTLPGQSLITVEAVAERIELTKWDIDEFTVAPIVFTNSTGVKWVFRNNTLRKGSPEHAIVRLGGVGGGSASLDEWAGSGFKASYELGDTKVGMHRVYDSGMRLRESESIFSKMTAYVRSAIAGTLAGANIGNDAVVSVDGDRSYRIGRTQVNVLSGDVRDNTCTTRYGIALRDGTTATTSVALNVTHKALVPGVDSTMGVGSPGLRFSELFAVNGSINTSDERLKHQIEQLPQALLDAAEMFEIISFKWRDALELKGSEARLHVGVIAQEIHRHLREHGIDGFEYGLLCHDRWQDEYAPVIDDSGEFTGEVELVVKGGDMWGIRPDQLQWLVLAAMKRKVARLEQRMSKLEE